MLTTVKLSVVTSVEDLQQRYNTVYFGFDKFNIEGEYVQILDAHAACLNATPASKVVVEGNTDERGTQSTTSL